MKKVNTKEFENIINENSLCIVDFYAEWCGPCKMLAPIIEDVSNNHKEIQFIKINIDEEQKLAFKYEVMSIPTILFFKNKKIVKRHTGFISKEQIEKIIKTLN